MRIIAGRFKRRTIKAPKGRLTRPTTDRTREAAFNLIESRVSLVGAHFLDLFAGSGAVALEALSRNALHATLVESDGRVFAYARENAALLGVEEECTFVRMDVLAYLRRKDDLAFDVIFADPPYDLPSVALLPELVLPRLSPDGLFVLEHDARVSLEHHPNLETSRAYGKSMLSIFRPGSDLDSPEN
ncbi:MAG: 16S rRNA (guanine(966)-N(2))-methyltransferase RsmD [Rhodothermales bacterium]